MDDENGETIEIDMSNNSWTYFDKHTDSIFTIFKHPILPLIVTGGGDNTAYLWTTHTQPPKFVGELQGHKESVIAGGFTSSGEFVITADMNGFIQVHKASKGGEKWVKFAELEEVEEVLFVTVHPSLPYFAFGANDGSVWVYQIDKSSKSLVQIMSGFSHSLECNGGVFIEGNDENDLSLVTISEDGTIVNWNCFTGTVNYKLQPHDDFKGVESPWVTVKVLKNVVAVGGRDGQLAIINNDTGKVVHGLKTLENVDDINELSIEAISWCKAPGNNLLAIGLVSGDILVFETSQWRLRRTIRVDDAITKLEFVEETPVLVGSSMNGKIYKWDARTGEELFVGVGHNMGVLDFAILEHGKQLITAGDEGVSLVFKTEN
ncbi:WD40-repeat-containing domain protein [Scheffersomyces amazonensis]|uniref:WD40-repeat-containing domain protein n=1 Tax=Scheffersomyces amazonensis TaxID=1078765 RepID=UPI00315DCC92